MFEFDMLDDAPGTLALNDEARDGDVGSGAAAPVEFGPERGRDIILVVDQARFHVHSAIVLCALGGKAFDTVVEVAYTGEHREVPLFGDSPKAWHALLKFIYDESKPWHAWELQDALLAVPLVHKYEGDEMLHGLIRALTAPEARCIRTPEVADLLVANHMESVIERWFADTSWRTYKNITLFLKGSNDDKVRKTALSCARQDLSWQNVYHDGKDAASTMVSEIAGLLSALAPDSRELATALMGDPCSRFARSAALATILRNGGFGQIAADWFEDAEWLNRLTPELMEGFLTDNSPEKIILSIISCTTREAKLLVKKPTRAIRTRAMIHKVVQHCRSWQYQPAIEGLVDAIPSSQHSVEMIERLAREGYLHKVIEWVSKLSSRDHLHELISTSGQIELVRAASVRLLHITEDAAKQTAKKLQHELDESRAELTGLRAKVKAVAARHAEELSGVLRGEGQTADEQATEPSFLSSRWG
mmetsp:Transcript_110500/g.219700  ORF Transcript_110500/g.219700 Transcript_110500/m.219700 type:complete len:476 (+) Transcript_110500:57-1484(+)